MVDMMDSIFSCFQSRKDAPPDHPVGVGIAFQADSKGALFVEALTADGPASNSGNVFHGDCLREVDGVDVYQRPIKEVVHRILGPAGTTVVLTFERSGRPVRVALTRGVSPPPVADFTCMWN
mmetsp:Transcript_1132/g.2452  ORF Transcript_1132/g.2452 Transcript_1132/m.2452 type:complete len:122 (-) Transcript_1132:27-392(-)